MLKWPKGVTRTQEFEAALAFVKRERRHLFVTGRAGTGKSTLLNGLRKAGLEADDRAGGRWGRC
jgi:ABC-type lipoprotein export system ATPase subunit